MTHDTPTTITIVSADELARDLHELGVLLRDCVHAGANINFVLPFAEHDGIAFWRDKVLPSVRRETCRMQAARTGDRIVGTVLLDCDTPPNQRHRAEVSKLMVHPGLRRRGIAKALMAELERQARRLDRSLITLDTRTGDHAEALYRELGYATAGVIPDFCRDPIEDRLYGTTVMYKALQA